MLKEGEECEFLRSRSESQAITTQVFLREAAGGKMAFVS
jgi:hypothetical protein